MRLFALLLALLFVTTPAFAQQGANVPITQMQNGGLIQPNDAIHVARCGFFGCDYQVNLGPVASLAALGANGTCAKTDGVTTFWGACGTGNGITALTGDVTASGTGSVAATIAEIQGTTVSGTTGSGNVVFSASPAFTGTISAVNESLGGTLLVTGSVTINSLADGCLQVTSHVITSVGAPCGSGGGGGAGTVTNFSFVNLHGASGNVDNASSTPALTLTPTAGGSFASSANSLGFFASTTSAQLAGVISDGTGSGSLVFGTSPVLTMPTLGVASATTINKVTITVPAIGSTLTIANGKTLTDNNTLTFTGTDGSSVNFGAGGTVLYGNQTITLTGDTTGSGTTAITTTTAKVNGVAYPASPSTDTTPIVTASNTVTYTGVPNCANDGAHGLVYSTSTHLFACASITGGGGGAVSSVSGDGSIYTNSASVGAVTLTLGNQSANTIFAGPASGSATTPTFRALAAADLPKSDLATTAAFMRRFQMNEFALPDQASGFGQMVRTNKANTFLKTQTISGSLQAIAGTVATVDFLQIAGGATGSPGAVTETAAGTDSNINIALLPAGTGGVAIGTTALGASGGFLTVKTSAAFGLEIDDSSTFGAGLVLNATGSGGNKWQFFSSTTADTGEGGALTFGPISVNSNMYNFSSSAVVAQISTGQYGWSSSNQALNTIDTGLSRDSAGVVDIGTGSQGSTAGKIQAASYIPTGSTIPPDGFYLPAANTSGIADNSQPVVKFIGTASAVDFVQIQNSATGSPGTVTITAAGTDTNINLNLVSKGSGTVECNGSSCGGGASAFSNAMIATVGMNSFGGL